jgi:hypothetical protein
LVSDLRAREDERQAREGEIIKELKEVNKKYNKGGESGAGIEKHLKKMVRKCLMLTLD